MKIFGLEISIRRARTIEKAQSSLAPVRGAWHVIYESFAGAWQRGVELRQQDVLAYFAVYACISLIAADMGKLRLRLVQRTDSGIWEEVEAASPFWPVLRKPNRYQTRQKFIESWITSKLVHGNAYILKQRDARGIVVALYVLDPVRVTPLVAPDGAVYYRLMSDNLAQLPEEQRTVPASEIIHDTMVCLHHPLIGVSPIYACGLAANQGLRIQETSAAFFANGAMPGGILTAPAHIDDDTAERLKRYWEEKYTGDKTGRVAVLGDGLKYEQLAVNAVDAQLIDQLRMTAEQVCSTFHVPPYKVGIGPTPTYQNAEVLNEIYYSDCLQSLIEGIEALLDDGLGLTAVQGRTLGTEFDLDDLMRMDSRSMVEVAAKSVGAGIVSPNEARRRWFNLGPVPGGASPYLQVQNYSLEALAARDAAGPPPTAPGATT